MKKKNQPPRKGNRVLSSYRRVGRKFVPPMLQAFQFDHVSWSSHIMPELIWWDVIADRVSHRFAAKVAEEIGKYFKGKDDRDHWWAFTSDYSHLSEDGATGLKVHLSQGNLLPQLTESLTDFLNLYPSCPISRLLDSRPSGIVDVRYLLRFEDRVRELEDKRSRNGVLIQSQAIYLGFVLGRLHVRQGLALADFPEVEHYPKTEKSLAVGASICAAVSMLAGRMLPKYSEDAWVQYFWRRSLDLRPLNFRNLEIQ
ncbi:MAG TPA: hypothetical protein VN950_08045 [Terriglobales bacterium]|nr:hypothetical protein [Terriglobales bacterium]